MQVIETSSEDKGKRQNELLSEKVRELENVVSHKLPMLYRRAFRYLGNAPDAEDAVQDALLSAWKHLAQFRGQAQMSSWLVAIVTNVARMQLRRRRRIHLSFDEPYGEEGLALSEQLPDSKPSPEQMCFATDVLGRLLKVAKRLSPAMRRAFQVRDIDGLGIKEAALVLGVPEGTLKAQLTRARVKLVRLLHERPGSQRSRIVARHRAAPRNPPRVGHRRVTRLVSAGKGINEQVALAS